jgi:hypothetical protein
MDNEVKKYIESITDANRKQDMYKLVELIAKGSSEQAKMWGSSIISFGMYHYKYESGREGDAPKIGLSSRKQAITLYGLYLSDENYANSKLLASLGKHKTGKGCLYISSLESIDVRVLEKMVRAAVLESKD